MKVKLSDNLGLEYRNGYYLVQVYSEKKNTGELYVTSTKTYAQLSGVSMYLECNGVPEPENLLELATEAKLQEGILNAKQANTLKERGGIGGKK